LAEELVFFLLHLLLLVEDLLEDLLVAQLSPLHLLLVHVPLPLQLLDKRPVLPFALLLFVQLVLQLLQTLPDSLPQLLQLGTGRVQISDFVFDLVDVGKQGIVLCLFLGELCLGLVEFSFLETHE
jgi:hypothetical protein